MYKKRFLLVGALNTLITNLILQFFLLLTEISIATFISQFISMIIGFYLHGKLVFANSQLSFYKFFKYFLFAFSIWIINWNGIILISNYGINKNLAAIILIPFLASFSYLIQKNKIFV
tara:strand:+ start:756 stop:1109 length:354 start_codon:yes stop_codon:yes gene_type:complete